MARFSPKEIARDFAYMSGARAVTLLTGFVRSLVIPGLLGPFNYGVWKTLGLIQAYAKFLDLGARASFRREIPYHIGRNDERALAQVVNVGFGANNISVLIAALVIAASSFVVEEPVLGAAMLVFLPLLYIEHIYAFLEHLLYGRKEFGFMSRVNILATVLGALLAIGCTWAFGLHGLIVGTALAYGTAVFVQLRHLAFAPRPRWDWSVYRRLVSIGFPAHLNGLLNNLFVSIDRLLILSLLGITSMGYYALATTINEYLYQLSYTFGNVLSPRLVERYAERERVEDLRGMVEVPLKIISRAAPLVLGTVYFLAEALIVLVLPSFEPALPPLKILLIGTYFSSIPRGLSSFFITIRKQAQTVPLYIAAIGVNALLVWWFVSSGRGLEGAAMGTTITLALLAAGLVVLAVRYFLRWTGISLFLLNLVWPLALGVLLVRAADHASHLLVGPGRELARLPLAAAFFALVYGPVPLLAAWRYVSRRVT